MNAMQFFGEPYPDAERPAILFTELEQVEAPVGLPCLQCDEPIAEGERGLIQSCYIRQDNEGRFVHTREPVHWECHIRSVIGSVKHQRGECFCFTGVSGHDDADYPTRREAARAALAEFEKAHL